MPNDSTTDSAPVLPPGAVMETPEERAEYEAKLQEYTKQQRNAGVGNEILAFSEGASKTMLPGWQALAYKAGTGVSPETLKELEETHPSATTAGEVAGFGLPALATMGGSAGAQAGAVGAGQLAARLTVPSLIGKVGTGVAKKLGGGLLAKTAAAGVEGALISGEQLVNEATLGDPVLNAENLVAHPGPTGKYVLDHLLEGTVMAGGLGAATALVGATAEKAARLVIPTKDNETLAEWVVGQLQKSEGGSYFRAASGGKVNVKGAVKTHLRQKSYDQAMDLARNMGPNGIGVLHKANGLGNEASEVLAASEGVAKGLGEKFEAIHDEAQANLTQKWGPVPMSLPQDPAQVSVLDSLEDAAASETEKAARVASKTSAADALAQARLDLADVNERIRAFRETASGAETATSAPASQFRQDAIDALTAAGYKPENAVANVDRALAELGDNAKNSGVLTFKAFSFKRSSEVIPRTGGQPGMSPAEWRAMQAAKGGTPGTGAAVEVPAELKALLDEARESRRAVLESRAKALDAMSTDRSARVVSAEAKAREAIEEVQKARQGMAKTAADVSAGKTPWSLDETFAKARKEIVDPLLKTASDASAGERVEAALSKWEEEYPTGATLRELHGMRQDADNIAFKNSRTGDPMSTATAEAFRDLRDLISKELSSRMESAGTLGQWKALNRDWATVSLAKSLALSGAAGDIANNSMPFLDVMGGLGSAAGALAGGAHLPFAALQGMATSAAMRTFRRNYPALAGRAAGGLAKWLSKIDTLKTWNENSLADAASRILSTTRQAGVAAALEATGKEPAKAAKPRDITAASAAQEDFRKRAASLRELKDPSVATERISAMTKDIGEHAPQIAQMAQALMARQIAFLASKLPPVPAQSLMQQVSGTPPVYGANTIAKFNRYYQTAKDPLVALEAAAMGALMKEHVETLENVWPQKLGQIAGHLVDGVAKTNGAIPSRTRNSFGLLMRTRVRNTPVPMLQMLYNQSKPQVQTGEPKASALTLATRTSLRPGQGQKNK